MKKIFLFLSLFPVLAFSQMKINELMTNNVSAVMDDAYNYSMWVEIYNSGTGSVNQNTCYFTDDLSNKTKWRAASKNIPAKGFSVLYFEGNASGHANFKLEPEGGTLYMFNGSGVELDKVTYPRQIRNTSYGRTTDGTGGWAFFINFTMGTSNNNSIATIDQCSNPSFLTVSGFHPSAISVTFKAPTDNDSIYYTTDATEPTRNSKFYTPGSSIPLTKTTVIRAQCFSEGKLASDLVSATFFIGEREFNLPVSSIITDPKNLTDNTIGIYVDGTNGKPHDSVGNRPVNWAQDWSRPANYELFDKLRSGRLNQEVDIKIVGNWSRANAQKSLAVNPKNKHGNNRLKYDEMFTSKPNLKYKSLMLRNSGNDWGGCMMRDAMMMSLVEKRMNIDCFAYEPAVIFINGQYYGIQNMRERGNEDFVFSNYGLKEEEIIYIEEWDLPYNSEYRQLYEYIDGNNMSQASNYNTALGMMDVDNFTDYMIAEMYYGNTDWPAKNIKTWKEKNGGKWRWVLYDTDLAFSDPTKDMMAFMLDYGSGDPIYNTANKKILKGLLNNNGFKDEFVERFCYHISTTFDPNRVKYVIDSLSTKIAKEIVYHKQRWGQGNNFESVLQSLKSFGERRPDYMMSHLSQRFFGGAPFYTLSVSSNRPEATYTYNNKYFVDRNSADLKVISPQSITVKALPVEGYEFDHWELLEVGANQLIADGSTWKYFDGGNIPAENWAASDYSDASWKSGKAPLGYVHDNSGFYNKIATKIGYGGNNADKYPTSYYRKNFTIENLASKNNFTATIYVDDGAAVYVNGTEVFRTNMKDGELAFEDYALAYAEITTSFEIPKNLLVEGENVIAVEVHQCNATSSDVIFDFNVSNVYSLNAEPIEQPVFEQVLTKNKSLRAVYKLSEGGEDPEKDMKVVINEVVSSNTKYEDADGEFDDYIELYNDSPYAVNIGGWYLSNDSESRQLYHIPSNQEEQTTIPSKGRLIIWADKQPGQGALHLNFDLNKDGATLLLSKYNYLDELVTVDQATVPALNNDESYSRVPDGAATWVVQPPTFNRDNEDVVVSNEDISLFINEIVSRNTKHEDTDGEFDSYIELYNDSPSDVNIGGWYLSDNPNNRKLSQIPDDQESQTTIASKGRLILWVDSQPEQGAQHLNFDLSEDGGTLSLSRYNDISEFVTVDQVSFPALGNDKSYSRLPDGGDTWVVQFSTFNRDNEDAISVDNGELLPAVYPTWVDDYFVVTNAGDSAIKLIGIAGATIEVTAAGDGRVNASGLQPGLYLVVVGDKTFKIVKR